MATKTLFLYSDPFFISDTIVNRGSFILDCLTDHEREDEEKIRGHLLKFAAVENLIELKTESTISTTVVQDTGSWIWITNSMNFRSLIDINQYSKLMSSIQRNDNYPINQIIDLHVRLGSLFSDRLLNTTVNRIMNSIQLIPYDPSSKAEGHTWEKIHKETPFIWLIIYLQVVIRSSTVKV